MERTQKLAYLAEYSSPPALDNFLLATREQIEDAGAIQIDYAAWTEAGIRNAESDIALAKEALALQKAGKAIFIARDDDGVYFAVESGE